MKSNLKFVNAICVIFGTRRHFVIIEKNFKIQIEWLKFPDGNFTAFFGYKYILSSRQQLSSSHCCHQSIICVHVHNHFLIVNCIGEEFSSL